jgi:hypothetical protein
MREVVDLSMLVSVVVIDPLKEVEERIHHEEAELEEQQVLLAVPLVEVAVTPEREMERTEPSWDL